ncbi:dTMP kinase [Candidatus Micrarchaeota archaeon]|nr:dTMP kinase [Candidatus Micrarchaeota archaeon]
MRGALIVFEGIDGSGKQTQIGLLLEKLEQQGTPAILFTYPDLAGEYGEQLSAILSKDQHLSPAQEFDVFAKDIAKDTLEINALVSKRNLVICDRFIFSTICYQSARAGGAEKQQFTLEQAKQETTALQLAQPDAVILLDLPAEEGLKRKHAQKTKTKEQIHSFEKDSSFLEQVRQNYLKLALQQFSARWAVFNALQQKRQIHENIYAFIHSTTK